VKEVIIWAAGQKDLIPWIVETKAKAEAAKAEVT
jgi:hypothetical protein